MKSEPAISQYRTAAQRGSRLCFWISLALLLNVVAVRPFMAELPFSSSGANFAVGTQQALDDQSSAGYLTNPSDPAGVIMAMIIFTAGALWVLAGALQGELDVKHKWLGALILVFAAISMLSITVATDRRWAWLSWINQVSMLVGFFLAVQLCRRRWALRMIVTVLVAVGLTMAAKGLWQMAVEFPSNAAYHQVYGLDGGATTPGSVGAALLSKRFLATTPYGYFALSNPFGSMLIVLGSVAAALAAARFSIAKADRQKSQGRRASSEVHIPTLSAILLAIAAVAIAAVLVLTRSRGAIAAGGATVIASILICRHRQRLGAKWRRNIVIAILVVLILVGAVVAMGLVNDSLPSRTMSFRWFYWTASAEMVEDHPLLGVGPGGFADEYLKYRRVEGEESIQGPHNFIVSAVAQHGIPGGICFVAIVLYILITISAPRRAARQCVNSPESKSHGESFMMVLIVAAVAAGRAIWGGHFTIDAMFMLEVFFPAVVMVLGLILVRWTSSTADISPQAGHTIIACGLCGFVLHNMVTFSMWMPGAAMTFWVLCGGAMVWRGVSDQPATTARTKLTRLRWPIALLAWTPLFATATLAAPGVIQGWSLMESASGQLAMGNTDQALQMARKAAKVDGLDSKAAGDVAMMFELKARLAKTILQRDIATGKAREWSLEAIKRKAGNFSNYRLAARIVSRTNWNRSPADMKRAVEYIRQAIELNQMDMRLQIESARMLLDANMNIECVAQLDRALFIDSHRYHHGRVGGSAMRLTSAELDNIAKLRARATSDMQN